MRLSRAAACRSLAGCFLALTLSTAAIAAAPPATVLEAAAQQKDLTTFVAAVKAAGLEATLNGAGPLAVFAPTDEAFARMPAAERAALMADPAKLKAVLLGHVINEEMKMHDGDTAVTSGWINSAGGGKLTFGSDGDRQTVNAAHVMRTDLRARNGTLNTIDRVLLT